MFLEAGFLGAEEGGGKGGAEETAVAAVGVEGGGAVDAVDSYDAAEDVSETGTGTGNGDWRSTYRSPE